jgi:hypothetical protein
MSIFRRWRWIKSHLVCLHWKIRKNNVLSVIKSQLTTKRIIFSDNNYTLILRSSLCYYCLTKVRESNRSYFVCCLFSSWQYFRNPLPLFATRYNDVLIRSVQDLKLENSKRIPRFGPWLNVIISKSPHAKLAWIIFFYFYMKDTHSWDSMSQRNISKSGIPVCVPWVA